MKNTKLIFGIWHPTKKWHIVHVIKDKEYPVKNYYAICDSDEYLNLNNICKHCIKKVDIEKIKTYIIYYKLGIKQ